MNEYRTMPRSLTAKAVKNVERQRKVVMSQWHSQWAAQAGRKWRITFVMLARQGWIWRRRWDLIEKWRKVCELVGDKSTAREDWWLFGRWWPGSRSARLWRKWSITKTGTAEKSLQMVNWSAKANSFWGYLKRCWCQMWERQSSQWPCRRAAKRTRKSTTLNSFWPRRREAHCRSYKATSNEQNN